LRFLISVFAESTRVLSNVWPRIGNESVPVSAMRTLAVIPIYDFTCFDDLVPIQQNAVTA